MSEALNRDLKAADIEQRLVEVGFRKLTPDAMTWAAAHGIIASAHTWHRVDAFLKDRFPNDQ